MRGRKQGSIGIGVGIFVDTDHDKVVRMRGLKLLEPGRFGLAWAAPGSPEIQHDSLALELRRSERIAAQRFYIQRPNMELLGVS